MITTKQKNQTRNKMGHQLSIWLTTGTAFALFLANINPILTFVSLSLAITYTIINLYDKYKIKKKKK